MYKVLNILGTSCLLIWHYSDIIDIQRQLMSVYARGNMLLRKCSPEVKLHLFRTYCTSMYTGQLWCNFSQDLRNIYFNFSLLISAHFTSNYGTFSSFSRILFLSSVTESKRFSIFFSHGFSSNLYSVILFSSVFKFCSLTVHRLHCLIHKLFSWYL